MTDTVRDLILFLAVTAVHVTLQFMFQYYRTRKGKSYEILSKSSRGAWLFSAIFGSWVFLDVLSDGVDSPMGWWLLCFLLGFGICYAIRFLVVKAGKSMWPEDDEKFPVIDFIRIPGWIKTAGIILLLLFTVVFLAGVTVLLIAKSHDLDTGMLMCAIFCEFLLIYGAVDCIRKLFRKRR